jgi:hypothetical protein
MSDILARVQVLAQRGEVRLSLHRFRELAADDILLDELVTGLGHAVVVEEYPAASKGASILVLQHDTEGRPVHVVWGIPKDQATPAVLVTAYRPDPERWSADFSRRRTR